MKKRIVALILILCLIPGVFALASCGPKKPAKTEKPTEKVTEVTTDRWEVYGPEIKAALDEESKSFKIELAEFNQVEKASRNQKYLAGPDKREGADSIGQKIYDRNAKAKELLGVTIEYAYWDYDQAKWGKSSGEINRIVTTKAPDAPDMFVNQIYDLNKAMLSDGVFKDILSLPGGYFDFEAPGWLYGWMKDMSFTGDRAYVLAGDYFLDILRSMAIMPFNADLMDESGSKLAPALFGEGLATGETMSQRFFDFVEEGDWTWDALGKLCEAVHVDAGTIGQDDMNDVLGVIADCYGGVCTASFIYSAGETLIERRENEAGKMWVYYPTDATEIGKIFDAVAGVFNGNGSLATYAKVDDTTEGIAAHRVKFANNELLFMGYALLGDLEDDVYQQMTSLYSVVPLPKVNARKSYNTFVADTADAGAINVNTSIGKARAISAYLQYCSEHSAAIRDEFLEIVTKYKTTVYNQGTDRMLDLIYESVQYGGAKVIDGAVKDQGGHKRWYDIMKDTPDKRCTVTSAEFKTEFDSLVVAKQSTLDEIMDKWYNLPIAGSEETPAP